MSGTRLTFAPQSLMLLSKFIDDMEVSKFSERLNDLSEIAFGGINTIRYTPEITLLSNILYYFPLLLNGEKTIGHNYCNLDLVSYYFNNGDQKAVVNPRISLKHLTLLAAVYCLLPYLYERKESIVFTFKSLWEIIVAEEDIDFSNSLINQENEETAETQSTDTSEEEKEENVVEVKFNFQDSIIGRIFNAICGSINKMADNNSERIESLLRFIKDIQLYLFLSNSRFLEFSMRFLSIRLISKSNSKLKMDLSSLSWVMAMRILLISYYGARILLSELDKEMNKPPISLQNPTEPNATEEKDQNNEEESKDNFDTLMNIENDNGTEKRQKTCPLCIDKLKNPAVVPCGHVFCWDCILGFCLNQGSETGFLAKVKCPNCRVEFTANKVLALYGYN